jgi:hypothetical protein
MLTRTFFALFLLAGCREKIAQPETSEDFAGSLEDQQVSQTAEDMFPLPPNSAGAAAPNAAAPTP